MMGAVLEHRLRPLAALPLLALLVALPAIMRAIDEPFYIVLASRILVFALVATSLNLLVGFGGMVSFGHAAFLGTGAYVVAILMHHGIGSAWIAWPAAVGVAALAALIIGAISLRTRGVYFIMITLAFAQMFYFLAVGLRQYGGDDGLSIPARSAFGPLALQDATVLYYVIFALLAATLYVLHRVVHARFGMVLQGCRENERRMIALGFPTLRYKLAAYVASALICVLAGVLLANLTQYASPAYMQWVVSGDLIVMILFGGMGTLLGPVVGAAAIIAIEDVLTAFRLGLPWGIDQVVNAHWMAILGALIIVVVLTLKQGLYGWLVHRAARAG